MARHRYYSKARGVASRLGGKGMISPVLGGFADHYLNTMLPISGVGSTAVGVFLHNGTVRDIGLYQIGHSLGNIIPIPGFGATGTGGGF